MNKIKLACMASFLAAGLAQAATPCDGFQIKVKNQLADNLVVTHIKLKNAVIQPRGIQKINGKSEQIFTVNRSTASLPMVGELVFHTISLPSKKVKISFDLTNSGLVCEHNDTSPDGDFSLEKTRLPGKVNYTITNN